MTVPDWLAPLVAATAEVTAADLTRISVPAGSGSRRAAVLVLFGTGEQGPDVLLIERASTMRSHAGQPAFPGGAVDTGDASAAATALRESAEEVGLDTSGVDVLRELPGLYLPPSNFVVTPVLAWWRQPSTVRPVSSAEVAAVDRVPLADLVEPANRVRVRHPSGWVGPAFQVRGLLVWGFTAGLLDRLLELGGLARPWGPGRLVDLPTPGARPAGPAGSVADADPVDPVDLDDRR